MNEDITKPYSFEEASSFGDGFPDRGIKCFKCNTLIPQLLNMDATRIENWRSILKTKGYIEADDYLISITGCNQRWAKIWRLHPCGPKTKTEYEAKFDLDTTCPFCGKPLRTKKSKQCPHCFKSWHNENA
jgi:hypothetical protein